MAQTYDVIVDTPKHHYQGKLALSPDGEMMDAKLEIHDVGSVTARGTRIGGTKDIDFAGSCDIAGQHVEYTALAVTWANSIDCKATTSIGEVTIYGTSTGYSAGDVLGADKDFAGRWSDA